jgi:hypothetical protein
MFRPAPGGAGRKRLLECPAMKRILRLGIVLLAATMHVVAPAVAYALAMPVAPGDFCSASRGAPVTTSGHRAPGPSGEHHCAHAPCCAGGAPEAAAAPPRVQPALFVARAPVRASTSVAAAAPSSAVAAAQPRGPPIL